MKQLIIARKDLNMSAGKLAAQCSHASMAFLTTSMRDSDNVERVYKNGEIIGYIPKQMIDKDIYKDWICGIFTKIVCEAKNRNHLMKVVDVASELGLVEGKDFFIIKDNCLTELVPEEIDENGVGRTTTCIGFKPLPDDIARLLSKKYQLMK